MKHALLAKIHIAKKELGLDDVAYRALLKRVTGKDSAGKCNDFQLGKVLDELKARGWKPKTKRKSKTPFKKPKNDQEAKIYALWSALEEAGALNDPSPASLRAFVSRTTGVSAVEFLKPAQAAKVIEGLKSWLNRVKKSSRHG